MGVIWHSVMKIRFTPSDTPPRPAEVLAKYKGNIQGIVKERKEVDEHHVRFKGLLTNLHFLNYLKKREHLEFWRDLSHMRRTYCTKQVNVGDKWCGL